MLSTSEVLPGAAADASPIAAEAWATMTDESSLAVAAAVAATRHAEPATIEADEVIAAVYH